MNQTNRKDFLEMLDVIGYQGDKEKFTDDFLTLCVEQAILDLTALLSADKQLEFKDKFKTLKDYEQIESLILEYFSKESFAEVYKKASEKVLADYLNSIIPSLSDDKKSNLEEFLERVAQ